MGSASTIECCQPRPSGQEFSSIVPSKLHAIEVVQQTYLAIKEAVSRTSFLSELDYYSAKLRENQTYRNNLLQLFPSFDDLLDVIHYEPSPHWITPIQSKSYDLALPRFNPLTGTTFPVQFGIIDSTGLNAQALFSRGNLKKTTLVMLDRDFNAYKEEEYLKLLINSLNEWQGLQDFVWVLDPQSTFADMQRHLLYHWSRFVGFINSELSLNDALSWVRVRYLYNFCLQVIANSPIPVLEKAYSIDNWVYQAESFLIAPGQSIIFAGFAKFTPFIDDNADYQEDTVRFNPPKGEEEVPKIKVKFVVKPLLKTGNKFRCYEHLYYLPLTVFLVQDMEQKYGQFYVFLKQQSTQDIIDYVSSNAMTHAIQKNLTKDSQRKMLNEILAYRDNIAMQIQNREANTKVDQCCIDFYKRYVKRRVALLSEQELPILSKKQMEICEQEVKVALDEEPTLEEAESQPRWVPVTPQEAANLERELHKYIKRLEFQKLQSQIDNADRFINITTLNISQCWLERLECLHCFPNLIQLFAYSNLLKKIEGLQRNENLRLLSLARNQIEILQNIDHLIHLRELYLTKNKLQLPSAIYLSRLNLPKLKLLTISFKHQVDECFEALLHRPPPRLKQLLISTVTIIRRGRSAGSSDKKHIASKVERSGHPVYSWLMLPIGPF